MQIMPYEDAKTYRYNPFDLTKVWPHGDYPLIDVGTITLNRNPIDYHTEIEQAAFEPNNLVPGIGPTPDKMLMAREFPTPAHRARLGVNYTQIPVNAAGRGTRLHQGRGGADSQRHRPCTGRTPRAARPPTRAPPPESGPRYPDGDLIRAAYTPRRDDDDWSQPGTMVRNVLDDAARDRLVGNIIGELLNGVTEPVLERAF